MLTHPSTILNVIKHVPHALAALHFQMETASSINNLRSALRTK